MNTAKLKVIPTSCPINLNHKHLVKFWKRVSKLQSGCWEWVGGKNQDGYGKFWVVSRSHGAHRVSWVIHNGQIPKGIQVLHKCDNPPCVNPSHLFSGSNLDNVSDRVAKGRSNATRGENHHFRLHPEKIIRGDEHFSRRHPELIPHGIEHHKATLNPEKILKIRKIYSEGSHSYKSIGAMFGVHKETVGDIIRRRYWKHVK